MVSHNSKLNNTAMVYVSTFDRDLVVGDVEPAVRNEMIQRCTDLLTKQQSYFAWKLLDYALRDCYGGGVKDFNLTVLGNGKWICNNGVNFSLTHCNNVVAVAVCNHPVGVDIEAVANFANRTDRDSFVDRVLLDSEQQVFNNAPAEHRAKILAQFWTQKESIFKMQDSATFVPKSIDTFIYTPHSQLLTINGDSYALSVATGIPVKIKLAQV